MLNISGSRWTCRMLLLIGLTSLLLSMSSGDIGAQSSWFEFTMPWDDNVPSVLSYPSSGPITDPISVNDLDGHLYAGAERIRLFGVNFTGSGNFLSETQAQGTAERLAKLGFNLVKFTLADTTLINVTDKDTLSWTVNEPQLDRLFYFINELKNNGVYVGLQLISRQLIQKFGQARPAVYFDKDLIQLQKDILSELLTVRVNPYTGQTLGEDPVLGQVQFLNEAYFVDSFRSCALHTKSECGGTGGVHITQTQSYTLDTEWNNRLLADYGNRDTLQQAWEQDCPLGKISLEPSEDPAAGTVKRLLFKNRDNYCPNRLIDTVTFYYQLAQEHIARMFDYLKNTLGLDMPITSIENFWGMPTKFAQNNTNVMAQHVPWLHPKFTSGFMVPPFQYWNAPMVSGPVVADPPPPGWPDWIEFRNTIWKIIATTVVKDKPFILGEYNHPLPNEFHPEFPLLISTYASLQDWDGILLHEYTTNPGQIGVGMINQGFELANDPAIMAQIPAAARLFRNGWVSEASQTIYVPFWEDGNFGVFDGGSWVWEEGMLDDWLQCLQKHYCYWEDLSIPNPKGISPAWSLVHKVRTEFCPSADTCPPVPNPGSPPTSVFDSDTGQLHWDMDNGLVTVDDDHAQAVIGFINSQQEVGPPSLRVNAQSGTDFAAVSLVPLDGSTIDASGQLLLTAVSRVKNTGMDPAPPQPQEELTFNSWGGPPVLLQPVVATVTLKLPQASRIQVYRLNACGEKDTTPIADISEVGMDQFTFNIGESGSFANTCSDEGNNTLWYGIEVVEFDTTAPALIADFSATRGNEQCTLSWTNPGDGDLAEVLVKRKTGSYPTDHSDGTTVYDNILPTPGESVNHVDSSLSNETTYYYAAFSRDSANNWDETVTEGSNAATCTPQPPGTAAVFRVTKDGDVYADKAYYCGLGNQGACLQVGSGADIAEYIKVSESVEPGDVVELNPNRPGYYRRSRNPYSALATGVISTAPGITMGKFPTSSSAVLPLTSILSMTLSGLELDSLKFTQHQLPINMDASLIDDPLSLGISLSELVKRLAQGLEETSNSKPLLALMGVVPVKATTENGPIQPGDLLVSSSTPGYAMRCADRLRCEGAIIGKALEPLERGIGVIKMLVMR